MSGTSGTITRWKNGKLHHDTLPSIEGISDWKSDGMKAWYKKGKLHRTDGPAFIPPSTLKSKTIKIIFQGRELTCHPDNLYWHGSWQRVEDFVQKDEYYFFGNKRRPFYKKS